MQKSLGLIMLIFYATGMILGAGVYSVIGKAAGVAHEGLWLSFLLAAVAALLTALSYAELSTLFPKAGAEYVYMKEIFPQKKILSFLCGCLMIFAAICTASTVALSFAAYLQDFFKAPEALVAMAVLALFTLVNIWGVRESGWMNIAFTLVELSGLVIFVYMGFKQPEFGKALSAPLSWGVATGASLIFFAYLGFENMVNLAEEAKEPEKNIPRAILISLVLTTAVYVAVSLAALALMNPEDLQSSDAVLSEALLKHSPEAAKMLGGIALFATANTVMIALLAASRIGLGMARGRDLPKMFAAILPKRQSPWLASLLVFALALLFLPLKKIEIIASVSSFVTIVVFIVVNAAVIYLRRKEPKRKRPFRVPGSVAGWPVLPVLAAGIALFFLFNFEEQVYYVGVGIVIFVLVVYQALHRRRA
ncbi:APC family permease [Bdellovibrio bacteriovorus]|uniref:Amino acid transporter n=1 Tax=Bdellovibrio bacteriovorus str. Tiberius TaxID=1069642 RepID=K7ZAA3_BDEBC|nr:APC family permease [Bdellovibrio bacteriovorus]AFY01569.1 amino acid transporter [Bdellovibrio bacteriovorus str. Tiberius]